jgi:UDP-N-acetylmuramyl pentapeptide phosphotransferase/UDP-N-acetylglucosamine-1-phosphate transferase
LFVSSAPHWSSALAAALVAGAATAALLTLLLRRSAVLPLDLPNERSLHSQPTPRIGGLGLFPAALLACLIASDSNPDTLLLLGLSAGLFTLSAFDDRRGLPVLVRLSGHLAAALGLSVVLLGPLPIALPAALAVAWMTNLYNFMDGSNGLAGGMALFGFAGFGLAGGYPVLSLALVGAAAGFLCYNFDPARVFLGDAGSIPLGFLAGGVGLAGVVREVWPLWFPLLVFSPFIVDASMTLMQRLRRGEKVWNAHRDHYYQRLIRMGCSHRQLAQMAYGLMAACGVTGIGLLHASTVIQLLGLASWCCTYVMLMWLIDRRWREFNGVSGSVA